MASFFLQTDTRAKWRQKWLFPLGEMHLKVGFSPDFGIPHMLDSKVNNFEVKINIALNVLLFATNSHHIHHVVSKLYFFNFKNKNSLSGTLFYVFWVSQNFSFVKFSCYSSPAQALLFIFIFSAEKVDIFYL